MQGFVVWAGHSSTFSLHLLNPYSSFADARVLLYYIFKILVFICSKHVGKRAHSFGANGALSLFLLGYALIFLSPNFVLLSTFVL